MVIVIHILTILFAICSVIIIKKKRYKVMPLISLVIVTAFVGFGVTSFIALVVPYGETLVYPLGTTIFGLILILVAFNDIYSLIKCHKKINGIYRGYNTYYGGKGVSVQAPMFEYTYNGTCYQEQSTQNSSYKRLTRELRNGETYDIYVDPRHPAVFILTRKLKVSTIVTLLLGVLFLLSGLVLLVSYFPVWCLMIG